MRPLKFSFAFLCLCASLFAQLDTYTLSYEVTLNASSAALSVQLPATGTNQAQIVDATVQCSATCYVRPEVNGAAASVGTGATAATFVQLDPELSAAMTTSRLTAWYGTGTAIPTGTALAPGGGWLVPASAILPLGASKTLYGAGTSKNYILRIVGPYTGDVKMFLVVRSRR